MNNHLEPIANAGAEMSRETSEWLNALQSKNPDDRWGINADEIQSESLQFVELARELVKRETIVLGVRAQRKADYFWYAQEAAQEHGTPEEQCYMGTRVKYNGSLSLEWYKNKFSTVPSPAGNKKRVFSEYIRKDTKNGYGESLHKGQPIWAKDLIGEVEREYQRVRKHTEILGKMKRLLRDYEAIIKAEAQQVEK